MTSGGTQIPFYNNNGIYEFGDKEISSGFGGDCGRLFQIPRIEEGREKWGHQRPAWIGEKYVPEHTHFSVDFNVKTVANLRHNMKNGKACGHFDRVPGELIKYGAPPSPGWLDSCLCKL